MSENLRWIASPIWITQIVTKFRYFIFTFAGCSNKFQILQRNFLAAFLGIFIFSFLTNVSVINKWKNHVAKYVTDDYETIYVKINTFHQKMS